MLWYDPTDFELVGLGKPQVDELSIIDPADYLPPDAEPAPATVFQTLERASAKFDLLTSSTLAVSADPATDKFAFGTETSSAGATEGAAINRTEDDFGALQSGDTWGDDDGDGTPNGEDPDWESAVVTGTRYKPPNMDGGGDPGTGGGGGTGDTGSGGTDHDCECDGLTASQKQEQAIDAEVAEVLREILQQANQAMEYGSLIWIDSNGVVQHTPLIPTPDEKAGIDNPSLPNVTDGSGRDDYSRVIGMVHSHPSYIAYNDTTYFRPNDPDYLLYPWSGDWASYDSYSSLIASTGGDPSSFTQFIIGWDGQQYVIKEYDASDRGTNTSASGEGVDPGTEACTC